MERSPTSARFLYTTFQYLGVFPLQNPKPDWRSGLHRVYMWFQASLCAGLVVTHFLNTVLRAVHYWPEFLQRLLEDVILDAIFLIMVGYRMKMDEFNKILKFTEDSFSPAYPHILLQTRRKVQLKFCMFGVLVGCVFVGFLLELWAPLDEAELAMRRRLYQTARPERRLVFDIWIPGVDETESWTYEILIILQLYCGFIAYLTSVIAIMVIPTLVIYSQGQQRILCKHIQLLGTPHYDSDGNRIFYSNFEKNDYVIVLYAMERMRLTRRGWSQVYRKKQTEYERQYFRQIVRFHQKLLDFQEQIVKLTDILAPSIVLMNLITFSLCFHQLLTNPRHLSPPRLFKYLSEFTSIVVQYYTFCNDGDTVDDFHYHLRNALWSSGWTASSTATRRGIVIILTRLQRTTNPRYCHGLVVISKEAFIDLVRLTFKVVNFLRLRGPRGL
ncbi:hypothetical protein M8J77_014630 [Diaphorina citri]|nr:hypothetical protein M8J77_014630 [Diaphorina citri]